VTEKLKIRLISKSQAWAAIKTQLFPYLTQVMQDEQTLILTVSPETRTLEQNDKMWATLTDISKQVDWYGQKLSPEDWKHVLSASLKKQRAVPGIDGGFVVLGQSTSQMSIKEMSDMIELATAFGAEQGVRFQTLGD
jgi:hypothetical protein